MSSRWPATNSLSRAGTSTHSNSASRLCGRLTSTDCRGCLSARSRDSRPRLRIKPMANELSLLKPIVESERADSHESRREMQRLEDEIRSLRRDLEDV